MSEFQKFNWPALCMVIIFTSCVESTVKSSGSCAAAERCACITNNNEFVFHCEGDLHVVVHRNHEEAKFSCNSTLPSEKLNRDYHSLLQLGSFRVRNFVFVECPEPSDSYSSLFTSHLGKLSLKNSSHELDYPINSLEINCGIRKEFTIQRKHFRGMNKLDILRIRCPSLMNLPSDLFFESLPKLSYIEITGIKSGHIPDNLFSKLEKLQYLEFFGSKVQRLQKNCLAGLKFMQRIHFSANKIVTVDDEIFNDHPNIVDVDLSDNNLKALPTSLEKLHLLEVLKLQKNFIRNFTLEDCSNLSSLFYLNLKDNLITEIDFECLTQMYQLTTVDVSGNNILKLPGAPISMENLETLSWNHNAANNIHVETFLISNSLLFLYLSNSSITSLSAQTIQGVPRLTELDLSWNSIKSLPQEFFIHNLDLVRVTLEGNLLTELPQGIFKNNSILSYLNLKCNKIAILNATMFARNSMITAIDISQNNLQEIPEDFLFDFERIDSLNFSGNNIKSLHSKLFTKASQLVSLDFSHNVIESLPKDIFLPLKESYSFRELSLEGNKLQKLPDFAFPKLQRLNLAGNKLQELPGSSFQKLPSLKQLDLSRNSLKKINPPFLSLLQNIISLDLSFNQLQSLPEYTFIDVPRLRVLNLSNNIITKFILESILGAIWLYELNLSNNNMSYFGVYSNSNYRETVRRICSGILEGLKCEEMKQSFPIKILKLSNNKLNFNYTQLKYNDVAGTWGRISPLIYCKNVEEVYLNNNYIDEIFLDWRVDFPYLRLLDLRWNKFKYLTHQEQLFSSVSILENGFIYPYNFSRPMVIDLQENSINSIELPTSLLSSISVKDKYSRIYRQITLIIGHNPLVCDCRLFNLLRVVNDDASLTSEIERRTGKKWMLPAKLDTKDLRCWLPASLKGKKINQPEEWMHHILPMLGLCSLENVD